MPITLSTPQQLSSLCGRAIPTEMTIPITQTLIDGFCAISGDHQAIHKATGEVGLSIAPGNLLVTLIPRLVQSAFTVQTYEKCLIAKYRSVRFLRPVFVGESIGMRLFVDKVKTLNDKTWVEITCHLNSDNITVATATLSDIYYHTQPIGTNLE